MNSVTPKNRSLLGFISGILALCSFGALWVRTGLTNGGAFSPLRFESDPLAFAWDLFLLVTYFSMHSVLAGSRAKEAVFTGDPARYRRFYLGAVLALSLALFIFWAPISLPPAWRISSPAAFAFHAVQALGAIGYAWSARSFDLKEFFGAQRSLSAQDALVATGPYALVRHPLYFFTFLILAAPNMTAERALLSAAIVLYIVIGSRIEERKLKIQWPQSYEAYAKRTPWLIPTPSSLRNALLPRR